MATRSQWSDEEFRERLRYLISQGFNNEEAFDLARWNHALNHWVIQNLINDRQRLLSNLEKQGRDQSDIGRIIRERYNRLGIRGQYEEEDWYFDRTTAPA